MQILSRLISFWKSVRFRNRWRVVYKDAQPLVPCDGIYLSICPREWRQTSTDCFVRVWQRIPNSIRNELQAHWKRLQVSWDGRNTGSPLHIPVIVFGRQGEMLAALGT